MNVEHLLEELQHMVANDPTILKLPIRVIEGSDYEENGIDAKPTTGSTTVPLKSTTLVNLDTKCLERLG